MRMTRGLWQCNASVRPSGEKNGSKASSGAGNEASTLAVSASNTTTSRSRGRCSAAGSLTTNPAAYRPSGDRYAGQSTVSGMLRSSRPVARSHVRIRLSDPIVRTRLTVGEEEEVSNTGVCEPRAPQGARRPHRATWPRAYPSVALGRRCFRPASRSAAGPPAGERERSTPPPAATNPLARRTVVVASFQLTTGPPAGRSGRAANAAPTPRARASGTGAVSPGPPVPPSTAAARPRPVTPRRASRRFSRSSPSATRRLRVLGDTPSAAAASSRVRPSR